MYRSRIFLSRHYLETIQLITAKVKLFHHYFTLSCLPERVVDINAMKDMYVKFGFFFKDGGTSLRGLLRSSEYRKRIKETVTWWQFSSFSRRVCMVDMDWKLMK
jgi:hypothetical protein